MTRPKRGREDVMEARKRDGQQRQHKKTGKKTHQRQRHAYASPQEPRILRRSRDSVFSAFVYHCGGVGEGVKVACKDV